MKTRLVELRWDTFSYPIKKGTPINKYGVQANDSSAIGIIIEEIASKDVFKHALVMVAGNVNLKEFQDAYGSNYENAALKAMDGIVFIDADGTRVPNVYPDAYVLPAATASKLGGVKQAANVAAAAGDAPTAAEFKALLDALKDAGIMVADATE